MRYHDLLGKTVYICIDVCKGIKAENILNERSNRVSGVKGGVNDRLQSPARASISWKVSAYNPARDTITLRTVVGWVAHTESLREFMKSVNAGYLGVE